MHTTGVRGSSEGADASACETAGMGSELSAEDISAIAERLASATAGPWQAFVEGRDHVAGDDCVRTGGLNDDSPDMYVSLATEGGVRPAGAQDLDFIAHARQDIGRLLDALEEGASASERHPNGTDADAERAAGRVALWLDPADLEWLAAHCACPEDAEPATTERCARLRFRASTALHKAGLRDAGGDR